MAVSLIGLLNKKNIRYQTTTTDEIQICCPFCGESRFRLSWNVVKNAAVCFNGGCDFRSKKAASAIFRKLEIEAAFDVPTFEPIETKKKVTRTPWPRDFKKLSPEGGYYNRKGYKYMRGRGMSSATIGAFHLGMVLTGRQRYRVLFPLTWRGKLRMLIGRSIFPDVEPRYLNSIGEKFVYNLPDKDAGTIVLSEGCVKAIAISAATSMPSCASLGHSITPLMIEQLQSAGVCRIVLWSDPDWQGLHGVRKMASLLEANGIDVSVLWPAPLKQADDYSKQQLRRMLKKRVKPYTKIMEIRYAVEEKKRKNS